jgi:hypothetical protein
MFEDLKYELQNLYEHDKVFFFFFFFLFCMGMLVWMVFVIMTKGFILYFTLAALFILYWLVHWIKT